MEMNRLEILKKIELGEVSVDEGFRLLSQLDAEQASEGQSAAVGASAFTMDEPTGTAETGEAYESPSMPDFNRFKAWNWVMTAFFAVVTALSAWWMISAWQKHPFGVGFWLSWIPFAIGIIGMVSSYNARWLHVRVKAKDKGEMKNIRVSMPVPLKLSLWVLKANPRWLPREIRDKNIGESLDDIERSITHDQPFYVSVDENDTHVEVFIG